jgi:hypothetical protein
MSPLLLGAAWLLFVISCLASLVPSGQRKSRVKPLKTGGRNETT